MRAFRYNYCFNKMLQTYLVLFEICSCVTLSGCLPSYEMYYVPSADEGEAQGKHLIFEKNGIKVHVTSGTSLPADRTSNLSLFVDVTSNIESRLRVCFSDFDILVDGAKSPLLPEKIVQRRYYTTPQLSTDVEIHNCTLIQGVNNLFFELEYNIRYAKMERFTLKPFFVELENASVHFPQVDFTLKSQWELHAINGG